MSQNENACLKLHKQSFKGTCQDFIISFNTEQTSIEDVLQVTLNLFEQLVNSFQPIPVQARLVAKVKFIHFKSDETEERFYHFTSYKAERVYDIADFYIRHMRKIGERLNSFHVNGSNLVIKNIEHIHICLDKLKNFMQM